jgi:alanine racemase
MEEINFDASFWQHKLPLTDSRQVVVAARSIFFALKGENTDGHTFIEKLYQTGVQHFVVSQPIKEKAYPNAHFIYVKDVLECLQAYAKRHRNKFDIPVIGITGSNGKTTVKEWLALLLGQQFNLVKSPKSYNSQLGVPLSVLMLNTQHNLALFEAGISQANRMHRLEAIIRPQIGIFTNIGKAHAQGFSNQTLKIKEKLRLFEASSTLIYCADHKKLHQTIQAIRPKGTISWGESPEATIPLRISDRTMSVTWEGKEIRFQLPFQNKAAIENIGHCLVTALFLGLSPSLLQEQLSLLSDLPMRLQLSEGRQQCTLLDDSYNNDLEGLGIALHFQAQQKGSLQHQSLILSDFKEMNGVEIYSKLSLLLKQYPIHRLVAIGPELFANQTLFKHIPNRHFFESTQHCLSAIQTQALPFRQECILLKGARVFKFEQLTQLLKKQVHSTVLEVNLNALRHNLLCYKNKLKPTTKIMAMVKASAYGSGSYEVAKLLQYHQIDFLGVAYPDEGISLRKKGIHVPIMVMNSTAEDIPLLLQHQLTPVIYRMQGLKQLIRYAKEYKQKLPFHLKMDTGMHRLGFTLNDLDDLCKLLQKNARHLDIQTVFSHLSVADDPTQQAFSEAQLKQFKLFKSTLSEILPKEVLYHILNSSGITQFPNEQHDMVRLGLGLYGIDPTKSMLHLHPVARLKTTIAQIKTLPKGASVGYGRKGILDRESRIGVISIGYADGLLRCFGNGAIQVKIQHKEAPTIGNICMDMAFIDLTDIPEAQEGDAVIIFDNQAQVIQLAQVAQTIPYEILTTIGDRVARHFYED